MFNNSAADYTPGTFLWQGTSRDSSGHFRLREAREQQAPKSGTISLLGGVEKRRSDVSLPVAIGQVFT